MPAAAVIPAPLAYIKVVAVKTFEVDSPSRHATAAGARHTPDTFVRELAAATHNGVPGRQPRDRSGTSRAGAWCPGSSHLP